VTVVTMLVCFFHIAREAAGAAGARHSLRPLMFRWAGRSGKNSRGCAARSRSCVCDRRLLFENRNAGNHWMRTVTLPAVIVRV